MDFNFVFYTDCRGPLLFIAHINDISYFHFSKSLLYADNLKVFNGIIKFSLLQNLMRRAVGKCYFLVETKLYITFRTKSVINNNLWFLIKVLCVLFYNKLLFVQRVD